MHQKLRRRLKQVTLTIITILIVAGLWVYLSGNRVWCQSWPDGGGFCAVTFSNGDIVDFTLTHDSLILYHWDASERVLRQYWTIIWGPLPA